MHRFRADYPAETPDMDASVYAAQRVPRLHDRLRADDLPRFEARVQDVPEHQHHPRRRRVPVRAEPGAGADPRADATGSTTRCPPSTTTLAATSGSRPSRTRASRSATSGMSCGPAPTTASRRRRRPVLGAEVPPGRRLSSASGAAPARPRPTGVDAAVTDVRNWFVFSRPSAGGTTTPSTRLRRHRRQVRRPEGEAGLHHPGGLAGLPVQLDPAGRSPDLPVRGHRRGVRTWLGRVHPLRPGPVPPLGLQLLVVTPLQKIHVIEPYVAAVGFVDNRTGSSSRIQTLTIEEFRARQARHAELAKLVRVD